MTTENIATQFFDNEQIDSQKALPMSSSSSAKDLISELFLTLNNKGIRYCHWKSNAFLNRTISGENDLDLLIHREDIQKFLTILMELNFKEALSPTGRQIPGVCDFYGFDQSLCWFVHVHAHFQLVVGHDATKNIHLSIENEYLNSVHMDGIIKVPSFEYEFALLVIRMVLKHLTWDAALRGEGHLFENEIAEIEYLRSRISLQKVREILNSQLPMLDWSNFEKCANFLNERKFGLKQFQEGEKLSNAIRVLSRQSEWRNFGQKISYRFSGFFRRRILHAPLKKRFSNGGLLIAIMGGDGSGKSTLIMELQNWLGSEFDNLTIHIGKPPWSFSTVIIRSLLKITRVLHIHPFLKAPVKYTADTQQIEFPGYPWAIREVCTAHDRVLAYKKARNYASNGGIAICDRFPIPGIRFMESPQIERMWNGKPKNRTINWLIKKEISYYKQILPADLMILLFVNPEIAVARKTQEDPEEVSERSNEIYQHDWSGSNVRLIDADQSKEEVLNLVKSLIWSHF